MRADDRCHARADEGDDGGLRGVRPGGRRARIVGGEGLQPTATATTVRVRDGERMLTDGPFAETKEQLGGFYLLDCNGPRRGDRAGGEDPRRRGRLGRGAAGHGLRGRRGRGHAAIGGGAQLAAPGAVVDRLFRRESGRAVATLIRDPRRLRPRRGGGAGGVRRSRSSAGRATACPTNPGGLDHDAPRATSAIDRLRRERALRGEAAASWRRWAARRGAATRTTTSSDPRRPAAADLHLLPPGAARPRRGSR